MSEGPESQWRLEKTDDPELYSGEITARTQAALNLINVARTMGFLDRVWLALSWVSGRVIGDATVLPRPGEEVGKWREQTGDGSRSMSQLAMEDDGESKSETVSPGAEAVQALIAKRKPGRSTEPRPEKLRSSRRQR